MSRQRRDWDKSENLSAQVPCTPGVEVTVEPVDQGTPESTPSAANVEEKRIGSRWEPCKECGELVWLEMNKEYFHRLHCSKSNGIAYKMDRGGLVGNHAPGCVCMICQSVRSK